MQKLIFNFVHKTQGTTMKTNWNPESKALSKN